LLVLLSDDMSTEKEIEHEVDFLHRLLFDAERLDNFVVAHELIDLNKYIVTNNSVTIKKILRNKKEKAFVFLYNKN